jgi:hypothetical protein
MSTDIIDVTLHTTSFPPTYIGKGTLIGNPYQAADVPETIVLKVTSAGNAISIPVGFFPTNVRVFNSTDGIIWEQMYGMPAANAIKTTLGGSFASVVDTTGQITVSGAARRTALATSRFCSARPSPAPLSCSASRSTANLTSHRSGLGRPCGLPFFSEGSRELRRL